MRTTTELTFRFNLTSYAMAEIPDFLECDDEGNFVELDVLDCETVSFESVEAELSIELFNQDAADDRIYDCNGHCCAHCGLEEREDFDMALLTHLGGQWLCAKCMPKSFETRMMLSELDRKLEVRMRNERAERATRFRLALEQAKVMRPDLNWAQYQYDPRQWA